MFLKTLVIDPIDGTLAYVNGKPDYATCVGFIQYQKMVAAMVYFPAWDKLYFLNSSGSGCVVEKLRDNGLQSTPPLVAHTALLRVCWNV